MLRTNAWYRALALTLALAFGLFISAGGAYPLYPEASRAYAEDGPTTVDAPGPDQTPAPAEISPEARKYLESAITLLQRLSIRTARVDWEAASPLIFAKAAGAQNPTDTYAAIRYAVSLLGEVHTSFFTPDEVHELSTGVLTGYGLLRDPKGDLVFAVDPGGPAEKAGIHPGDRVQRANSLPTPLNGRIDVIVKRPDGTVDTVTLEPAPVRATGAPVGRDLGSALGYVEVPSVVGGTRAELADVASAIQGAIRSADTSNTCGWVVDLRRNTGGDPFAMFAGIGPILGEGEFGSWIAADGFSAKWGYHAGAGTLLGRAVQSVADKPYRLLNPQAPAVAILTSSATASAAEMVLISFIGRTQTRTFGGPTYGVTTANSFVPLSDGAAINITFAIDADHSGKTYDGPIAPDQVVATDWTKFGTDRDAVIQSAETWLRGQPVCAPPAAEPTFG